MIYVNGNKVEQNHFSAGELKVNLVRRVSTVDVVWNYESDAELFTIACIRDYYKDKVCNLYMPYLPHARMDRVKTTEDVFTLKTFTKMINAMNFNSIIVWDAHSNVGVALLDRCKNVSADFYIARAIEGMGYEMDDICLFFPDEGAQKRYGDMFIDHKQAFGIKKRNWETQKIEGYMIVGEENIKGKHILIIDDICSYGNTFVKAAEALNEAGAADISLYVTHCEDAISKGDIFKKNLFKKVFTTGSLVRSEETNARLEIV